MKSFKLLKLISQLIFILLACVICSPLFAASGKSEIINSVDVKSSQQQSDILIDFNYPVHYVSHAPQEQGTTLKIMLRPGLESRLETNPDLWKQSGIRMWTPTPDVPLQKISYEGVGSDNLQLTLEFETAVNYSVRSLPENKSIVVSLRKSSRPVAQGNVGRGYIYAINLKSSIRPIDADAAASLPALQEQEVYVATHTAEDRTWYRLRAGFFEDHDVAKQKLAEVREAYPRAWIAVATEDDQLVSNQSSPANKAATDNEIETILQQKRIDPYREYAINLSSMKTPIDTKSLPALQLFDDYVVYTSRATIDGVVWHRLRIGFFETEAEAEVARQQLAGFYRSSATIKVARKERYVAAGLPEPDSLEIANGADIEGALKPLETESGTTDQSSLPEETPRSAGLPTDTAEAAARAAAAATEVADSKAAAATIAANTVPLDEDMLLITQRELPPGDDKLAALMEEARQAMAKGDYSRGIALYNKILQMAPNPYQQDALEFMGLARERKGQLAHAKAEYEKFLQLYPEGDAATRVKQRLAGLITSQDTPRVALEKNKRNKSRSDWDFYGGVSQYYRKDLNNTDDQGDIVTQESLATDFDFTARRRTEKYSFGSRVSAGHLNDFTTDGDNESRVSSLYFDLADNNKKYFFRLGRQSRSSGGVLGRFDGGLFSYQFNKTYKANVVAGYPVDSSKDGLISDRKLYGASVDISSLFKGWDFTAFAIQQMNHDLVDRRSVGAESRYFDPKKSFFSLVDYDTFYGSLNNMLMLGTLTLDNKTTLSMTLDYRNSPVLTTNNALQSQTVETIPELQNLFSDDEIYGLAEDRTADSSTLTLSASRPLNDTYQLNMDVSYSEFGETPASGGVPEAPGDTSIYYSTQLIGSSLFKDGDISIMGLRYSDTDTADTLSLSLNTRYPVSQEFRVNPRLRLDYRVNQFDDSTQWTVAPSLRLDYRWKRNLRFEMDIGGEFSTRDIEDVEDSKSYFLNLGYRYDF